MITERLAKQGVTVVAGCLTAEGQENLQRTVPSAVVLRLDVTQQASVDAFAAEALRRFPGKIYAVINNAYGLGCTREPAVAPVVRWRDTLLLYARRSR